jgi:hypothetical protein
MATKKQTAARANFARQARAKGASNVGRAAKSTTELKKKKRARQVGTNQARRRLGEALKTPWGGLRQSLLSRRPQERGPHERASIC